VCHQTVCLIARHLESRGIPTLCMASALDIVQAGNPPRAVFVDYPLGHTTGKPFDPTDQHAVVKAALLALERITRPGEIVHLPQRWSEGEEWKRGTVDPGTGDRRQPRDTTPQYQTEDDRRLAEGA
jgi:hypothetical protein